MLFLLIRSSFVPRHAVAWERVHDGATIDRGRLTVAHGFSSTSTEDLSTSYLRDTGSGSWGVAGRPPKPNVSRCHADNGC